MTPAQWSKIVDIGAPVWENVGEGIITVELEDAERPSDLGSRRLILIPPGVAMQCVLTSDHEGALYLYGRHGERTSFVFVDGPEGVAHLSGLFDEESDLARQSPEAN